MRVASVVPGLALWAAVYAFLPACSGDGRSSCSVTTDCQSGEVCINNVCVSGSADAGPSDAGESADSGVDAGTPDAGSTDAGALDAGTSDAGISDAGISDAGASDGGHPDAMVPGAPTNVVATAGFDNALVTWTAPASSGGAPITGYIVTGVPSGTAMTTGATRVYVSGLTAGVSYTFTVAATNVAGTGPASSPPSAAVTPWDCNAQTVEQSTNCPNGEVCGLNQICTNPQYSASTGTVTDGVTGLVWQQAAAPGMFTWDSTGQSTSSAQYYCAHLTLGGSSGWRLPTVDELFSLVVMGSLPPIDQTEFPGTAEDGFWTSTPETGTSYIWTIYFGPTASYIQSGSEETALTSASASVRCVH